MSNDHHLVGLVGPAGAGKDTIAGLLVVEHGFGRAAFADPIRAFVRAIDPGWAMAEKVFGYERAKAEVAGFRSRLIEVGDAARTHINSEVWVDAVDGLVEGLRDSVSVVVSDVRRSNEAEWIAECGGDLVAVYRAGLEPEDRDMARMMRDADFEIENSGTPEALAVSVAELVDWLEP